MVICDVPKYTFKASCFVFTAFTSVAALFALAVAALLLLVILMYSAYKNEEFLDVICNRICKRNLEAVRGVVKIPKTNGSV
jgi:uncharacterized membrane protein